MGLITTASAGRRQRVEEIAVGNDVAGWLSVGDDTLTAGTEDISAVVSRVSAGLRAGLTLDGTEAGGNVLAGIGRGGPEVLLELA